eukprot:2942666-Prymnesium_polylepis.1
MCIRDRSPPQARFAHSPRLAACDAPQLRAAGFGGLIVALLDASADALPPSGSPPPIQGVNL